MKARCTEEEILMKALTPRYDIVLLAQPVVTDL